MKKDIKNIQSNLNPGPLQSPSRRVLLVVCSCSSSVAMTATMSARCPADALEVTVATRMASRDCEGQSEPINWTMLRDRKKQDKDQITNYASCHFYSCFAKKCVFYVCLFCWFTVVLLFMQAFDDCVLSVDVQGGRT